MENGEPAHIFNLFQYYKTQISDHWLSKPCIRPVAMVCDSMYSE